MLIENTADAKEWLSLIVILNKPGLRRERI